MVERTGISPSAATTAPQADSSLLCHLRGNLYFSFETTHNTQANINKCRDPHSKWIVIGVTHDPDSHSLPEFKVCLEDIYRFERRMLNYCAESECSEGSNIVICAGQQPLDHLRAAFLTGCHLMIRGHTYDETCLLFNAINARIIHECNDLSLQDFWSAFYTARRMGWLNFHGPTDGQLEENELDIEEYLHYSR